MIRSLLSNRKFYSALNDRVKRLKAVVNSIRFGCRSFCFTSLDGYGRLPPCILLPSNWMHRDKNRFQRLFGGTARYSSCQGGTGDRKLTVPVSTMDLLGKVEEETKFNNSETNCTSNNMNLVTAASIQEPAGKLYECDYPSSDSSFIPQVPLNEKDFQRKARVLVLCTGGTRHHLLKPAKLTMGPNESFGGSLAPITGALTSYLQSMPELNNPEMPSITVHEYTPLLDSSDMGPGDWALLARDIQTNYYHFDGFVILMGTDTMAYAATALSFMLENLGKPVIFTGSQIPLCQPYNDARRNVIMALIFASRDTFHEVAIFFHDRLLRACRSTKVNTDKLLAFDSPNQEPLAKIGINIDENEHLFRPPPRGSLRVHTRMDTRLLTLRLIPGFDDAMMKHIVHAARQTQLKSLVLQLYGAGNLPMIKDDFIRVLADATDAGVLVVASSQCYSGSVVMGYYATGRALLDAGVVSANDMTLEAITCKLAYLHGRGDLSFQEIAKLMDVSLRGEVTPADEFPEPPFSRELNRTTRQGRKHL